MSGRKPGKLRTRTGTEPDKPPTKPVGKRDVFPEFVSIVSIGANGRPFKTMLVEQPDMATGGKKVAFVFKQEAEKTLPEQQAVVYLGPQLVKDMLKLLRQVEVAMVKLGAL